MALFRIKSGDTRPYFAVTLSYTDGTAVVLTGASVLFKMRDDSGALKVNAAAVVTDAASGQCEYRPVAADTDTPGNYLAEWQVTFADGTIQTFPTRNHDRVRVIGDLDP